MSAPKEILLGSGHLYSMEYTNVLPEVEEICTEANRFSYIQGGATLEYKQTKYTAKDDLGYAQKTIMTDEGATLKTGLMTFNGESLSTLLDTARVSEDAVDHRTTLIGGIGNAKDSRRVWCFHHPDPVDSDIYVTIVGSNEAGFSLAFTKEKESVIDAELTCLPSDDEGTLIRFTEKFKGVELTEPEEPENAG